MTHTIKKILNKLKDAYSTVQNKGIDLNTNKKTDFGNFNSQKENYTRTTIKFSINELKKAIWKIPSNNPACSAIATLHTQLENNKSNPKTAMQIINKMANLAIELKEEPPERKIRIKTDYMSTEIKTEMQEDINEMQRCFNAECYRSTIILCGRILETALHRKYYEVTNKDILETNPGIGLGTLISKLSDKNVQFDPGLTQQIHLINQVRIFSVHKKQNTFKPTKTQTKAMMLYTLDILNKLFEK